MPCRHSRSATGRGPGAFSGQGGSSGSISAHKSSSTIHGPSTHSITNGRIIRLVTPDQATSTRSCYELKGPAGNQHVGLILFLSRSRYLAMSVGVRKRAVEAGM